MDMTDEELNRLAQQAVHDAVFPVEKRPAYEAPAPLTPEEQAKWDARVRMGYYIPGVGAFDRDEGPEADEDYTCQATTVPPFHIGDGNTLAEPDACAHCGCTTFNLGSARFFTALRCTGCGREWCEHEG